jgi:hypothetical protein
VATSNQRIEPLIALMVSKLSKIIVLMCMSTTSGLADRQPAAMLIEQSILHPLRPS